MKSRSLLALFALLAVSTVSLAHAGDPDTGTEREVLRPDEQASAAKPVPEYLCEDPGPDVFVKESRLAEKYDPNHPVAFQLNEQLKFSIPRPYTYPRTFWSHLGCDPKTDLFGFAFWMPDLRAPQHDMWGRPDFRIREDGRPKPGKDEFLVIIPTVEVVTDEEDAPSSNKAPWRQFKNNMTYLVGKRYMLKLEYGGLIHVAPVKEKIGGEVYVNFEDGRDEIMIDCDYPYQCFFDLYLSDHGLGMRGTFPKDALSHWREIKTGLTP